MKLFEIEPEVAGGFGENTVISNFDNVRLKRERPVVTHLHYEFSGWLGDEILEATPCFIVTENLADSIQKSKLKGFTFVDVETSVTEDFEEIYPGRKLLKFKRILPGDTVNVKEHGFKNWSGHDFCLSQNATLVVSENALVVLKKHKFEHCDVKERHD